jgi:hypothetical protein
VAAAEVAGVTSSLALLVQVVTAGSTVVLVVAVGIHPAARWEPLVSVQMASSRLLTHQQAVAVAVPSSAASQIQLSRKAG